MQVHIPYGWPLFCITFGVMLITLFIFARLSKNLYTMDVVQRRFSIIDLQWPSNPGEFKNLVRGLFALPGDYRQKAISSLKASLLLDFVFMPATYGSIFLLCMKISWKMKSPVGKEIFAVFAWLQALAFLLDIIENIYLWQKIRPDMQEPSKGIFKAGQFLEILKWGIPSTAAICAFSSALYYWLVGIFLKDSLVYLLVIVAELILFAFLPKIFPPSKTSIKADINEQ